MSTRPLTDRMQEDMQLRGLAPLTQKSYLDAVASLARFCGAIPAASVRARRD
jgi:hypothetical protein